MNIRWAALAAILLVAAGCASTSKVMLGRARAPIDPALVQIYSTPPAYPRKSRSWNRRLPWASARRARPTLQWRA